MVFRSKIDIFFVNFILIVILLLALASFWPLFFFNKIDLFEFLLLSSTFLIPAGVILWSVFSIKYVYYQDFLLVQGGPYKSRRDAIDIYSKQAFWGSVTISPMCKEEFISELKKRCPNMNIRE